MKRLRFYEPLSKLILAGEKTTTWRLFDDKNLSEGDVLTFVVTQSNREFAIAEIISVKETLLGKLTEEDWEGHERFSSDQEMYQTYQKYYDHPVDENTSLKIIKFKVTEIL